MVQQKVFRLCTKVFSGLLLAVLVYPVLFPLTAFGASYDMEVFVDRDSLGGIKESTATMTVKWKDQSSEVCFYLAFNDRHYFWNPAKNIHRNINKNKSFRPSLGKISIDSVSQPFEDQGSIIRLKNRGSVKIDFNFILPQWPDRARKQFLFHQFYPQKLQSCPESDLKVYHTIENSRFQAKVQYPKRWALTSPGYHHQGNIEAEGRFLSFNLSLGYRVERFFVNKTPVTVVYQSQFMNRGKFYLQRFLQKAETLLGRYPYERLLFIESEDLEREAIPGIISMNRLRQSGMEAIQNELLNWGLWQLAYYTSQQWFAASVYMDSKDDAWFLRGAADFIASILLKEDSRVYNIFNSANGDPWLSLDHRQSADLIASVLGVIKPENALIGDDLKTKISFLEQHNFSYIRNLMALRFAYWHRGEKFLSLLRSYIKERRFKVFTPEGFLRYLRVHDMDLAEFIQLWWQSSEWPDFDLDEIHRDGETLRVTVKQNEAFRLPFDISVKTDSGKVLNERFTAQNEVVELNLAELGEDSVSKVEINPNREIFDGDRFNNSNSWPGLTFFPGNASTIRDDAYTVVWVPFPSKLPGEELSLVLSSQIFKYVNSGLSLVVSHIPSANQTGYNALFLSDVKWASAIAQISVVQDFGAGLKGQRIIDAEFSRPNLLPSLEGLSLGLRFRHRATLDRPESNHGTVALVSRWNSVEASSCGFQLSGVAEQSLKVTDRFTYNRNYAVASMGCQQKNFGLSLRGFFGQVTEEGSPPSYVRFSPQALDEARMRIDNPTLNSVQRIWTVGLDVDIPAYLPIPSALFLLPSHSRWRFFYDYGYADDTDNEYQDYGIGFKLPLGGDVVGKRSLSFASFSVLAVLHKKFEGRVEDKPGVLIDFQGKL